MARWRREHPDRKAEDNARRVWFGSFYAGYAETSEYARLVEDELVRRLSDSYAALQAKWEAEWEALREESLDRGRR
jgi:hypothetical protein